MPGGRPRKTTADLPDNWKELIYDWSAEGCSGVEIRARFCLLKGKFSEGTWLALQERDAEFLNTIKKANILCQAWWERKCRQALDHEKGVVFETGAWFANMKNRFGWKDKTELDANINNRYLKDEFKDMTDDEVLEKAKKALKNVQ